METTRANAVLITSTRSNDGADGVVENWDATKAYAAVAAIKKLASNYLAVSVALGDQALALEDVTSRATALIHEVA